MSPHITTIALPTVWDLMDALDPMQAIWQPDPTEWMFRGLTDARWQLLPTAHRKESWLSFAKPGKEPHDPTGPDVFKSGEQDEAEEDVLVRFAFALNEAGLPFPGLYDPQHNSRFLSPGVCPQPYAWELMAFARHYGVPARLLDWSRNRLVAAYFAAEGGPSTTGGQSEVAVWALRSSFIPRAVEAFRGQGQVTRSNVRAAIVSAARATNLNLNAQHGLFTMTWGDANGPTPFDEVIGELAGDRPVE